MPSGDNTCRSLEHLVAVEREEESMTGQYKVEDGARQCFIQEN